MDERLRAGGGDPVNVFPPGSLVSSHYDRWASATAHVGQGGCVFHTCALALVIAYDPDTRQHMLLFDGTYGWLHVFNDFWLRAQ
jgi:hypothetical protein